MNDQVTRKKIKPSDCCLLLSIPTTRSAFFEALEQSENRDFISNLYPIWPKYKQEVIRYTDQLLPDIATLGVSVFQDVTFDRFKALLNLQKHSVVILFAHWKDESVEFADRLVPVPSIVRSVPLSYKGFIDLCVCHPLRLATEL